MSCKVAGCRYSDTHTTLGHCCGKCNLFGHGRVECGKKDLMDALILYHDDKISVDDRCSLRTCGDKSKYHTEQAHYCTMCYKRHSEFECDINAGKYKVICPLCMAPNMYLNATKINSNDTCDVCLTNKVSTELPLCKHRCLCIDCLHELEKAHTNPALFTKTFNINDAIIVDIPDHIKEDALKIMGDVDGKVFTMTYGGMGSCFFVRRSSVDSPLSAVFMHSDSWGQYGPETDDRPYLSLFAEGYKFIKELT